MPVVQETKEADFDDSDDIEGEEERKSFFNSILSRSLNDDLNDSVAQIVQSTVWQGTEDAKSQSAFSKMNNSNNNFSMNLMSNLQDRSMDFNSSHQLKPSSTAPHANIHLEGLNENNNQAMDANSRHLSNLQRLMSPPAKVLTIENLTKHNQSQNKKPKPAIQSESGAIRRNNLFLSNNVEQKAANNVYATLSKNDSQTFSNAGKPGDFNNRKSRYIESRKNQIEKTQSQTWNRNKSQRSNDSAANMVPQTVAGKRNLNLKDARSPPSHKLLMTGHQRAAETLRSSYRQTSRSSYRSDHSQDNNQNHPQCDCLEKLNLKVEKEMDRLRGEFRTKEAELMQNVSRKLVNLDGQVQNLASAFQQSQTDTRETLDVQEQTVSFILNSVQSLTTLLHAAAQNNQSVQRLTQNSLNVINESELFDGDSSIIHATPGRLDQRDTLDLSIVNLDETQGLQTIGKHLDKFIHQRESATNKKQVSEQKQSLSSYKNPPRSKIIPTSLNSKFAQSRQ